MRKNSNSTPIDTQEALEQSLDFRRMTVFDLAAAVKNFIAQPQPTLSLRNRVALVKAKLARATDAGWQDAMLVDGHRDYPVYVCTGEEANFSWLSSELHACDMLADWHAREYIIRICDEILSGHYTAERFDPGMIHEIMHWLEEEFDYLSRVIGPDGVHRFILPTVSVTDMGHVDAMDLNKYGCVEEHSVIFNEPSGEHLISFEFSIYEAAVSAILEATGYHDEMPEGTLDFLEVTFRPDIRKKDYDDQLSDFFYALHMGISYHAPYGDFEQYEDIPDEYQVAWACYANRMISESGRRVR